MKHYLQLSTKTPQKTCWAMPNLLTLHHGREGEYHVLNDTVYDVLI